MTGGDEVQAVIFDFNGTLSDDEPILFTIFADLFAERWGYELTREMYFGPLAGHSDSDIIGTVVAARMPAATSTARDAAAMELLERRRARYLEAVARTCPILPATVELVHALTNRQLPLAIVTGAQRADVLHVLAHSPISAAFAHIVTDEDVERGKPDPQGFLMAAAALDVDPARIVVFEDSVAGIRATRSAGMRCIAVCGTHDEQMLRAECPDVVAALSPAALALL